MTTRPTVQLIVLINFKILLRKRRVTRLFK